MSRITEFKRKSVISLCAMVLGEKLLHLNFSSFSTKPDLNEATACLCFLEGQKRIELRFLSSSFIASTFEEIRSFYSKKFPSVCNISLAGHRFASPALSSGPKQAHIDVCTPHSYSTFLGPPATIEHSSCSAMLEMFEFYINCELAFFSLLDVAKNANTRNRQDIYQRACFDMSKLTSVNSYEICEKKL